MRWLYAFALVGCGICSTVNAQQFSVLVTPRTTLDVQVQQSQQTPQVAAPMQYVQPPPMQYAQPMPVERDSHFRQYLRYRAWFNAGYQRRGIVFPRYVRRPNAVRNQMALMYLWNQ